MIDIPAYIAHLERMIRNAENQRMAAFLEDLMRKLSDPTHIPTGEWNQAGEWGHSDFSLIPAWIRLDAYDESRVLECISYEQKLAFWKMKENSRKRMELKHKAHLWSAEHQNSGRKQTKILKALQSGEWITVERLMKRSGAKSPNAVRLHVDDLRASGHRIRRHLNSYRLLAAGEATGQPNATVLPRSAAGIVSLSSRDRRISTVLESEEWMTIESLMAVAESPRPAAIREIICRLRKHGYLICTRRNPGTEYRLTGKEKEPSATALSKKARQVPAKHVAEIHPVQGIEEDDNDESGNTNHNSRNGADVFRCVESGGS